MKLNLIHALLIGITCSMLLQSCMTADKATGYLSAHPKLAAGYCAAQYPVKETMTFIPTVDSSSWLSTVAGLTNYSDSLLNQVGKKDSLWRDVMLHFNQLSMQGYWDKAKIDVLQAQIDGLKPVDKVALRRSIEAEIRSQVKPCHDTTITKTVVDNAKVEYYRLSLVDEQNKSKSEQAAKDKWKKIALISLGVNLLFVVGLLIKIIK